MKKEKKAGENEGEQIDMPKLERRTKAGRTTVDKEKITCRRKIRKINLDQRVKLSFHEL